MRKKLITFLSVMLIPMFLGGCFNKEKDPKYDNTVNQGGLDGNDYSKDDDNLTEEDNLAEEDNNTEEENKTNEEDNKGDSNSGEKDNTGSNNNQNNNGDKEDNKEEIVKEKMNLRIFYQDINNNIYYKDKEVLVEDKAIVKAVTDELKKDYSSEIESKTPDNIQVRNAKIEDGILTVDFGKGAFDNINLGSSFEMGMIDCMVNSYGYNLGVDKVIFKVNGENYASGHILLEDGDCFTVNYNGVQELQ